MNLSIIDFAIMAHEGVNHRYNGSPYSVHLALVVDYANKFLNCIPDTVHDNVIAACWLHDTIEDCRLSYNDIKQRAGEDVADIVYAVTNEKGKSRKERANEKYYTGIRQQPWAIFVKMCDRLANVAYSKQSKSRMFDMYRNENNSFLESMFPKLNEGYNHYIPMIEELNSLLTTPDSEG